MVYHQQNQLPTDGVSVDAESAVSRKVRQPLRLGTHANTLARRKAEWVSGKLETLGISTELIPITAQGDDSKRPFSGQGAFTKEVQQALLDDRIDLAVHSLKDLPTDPVDGLMLAAIPPRERVADALISPIANDLAGLPENARVGTNSIRRRAQLLHVRPDLQVLELRGDLEARLKKLDDGQYDAILLAEAGLRRLGWEERIAYAFPPTEMMPAVGQGALGIEIRSSDDDLFETLDSLTDLDAACAVLAERALLATLRVGCSAPLGAWGRTVDDQLCLDAVVLSTNGQMRLAVSESGDLEDPVGLGQHVANRLVEDGAERLLLDAY